MLRRAAALLLLLIAAHALAVGQTARPAGDDANAANLKRLTLISDLQFLASDALNLEKPLARALAQAEIADAAWPLDEAWAKKLLREAYELTLPPEDEQKRLRSRPAGSPPNFSSGASRARGTLRHRIFEIARRDPAFAAELTSLAGQKLGIHEEQSAYVTLSGRAAAAGDVATAGDYARRAMQLDPSYIEISFVVNEIARTDRAAADALILQYYDLLRAFPVSREDQSSMRTMFAMSVLTDPSMFSNLTGQPPVERPGPEVMRAHIRYVLDAVSRQGPADMQNARLWLLSVWGPLKQYAPELTEAFLELEVKSRRPNETVPLPKNSMEEVYRKRQQEELRAALNRDEPDERAINVAISRGEFDKARKLINKLDEGPQKTQHLDSVNAREARSLAAKGDLVGAGRLALQLKRAAFVLQVYPEVVGRCVAKKDQGCALRLVTQAVAQLKRADTTTPTPPPGIPASAIPDGREFDPVLMGLSRLAKLILPVDESLGREAVGEMIAAANRSELDTEQGRTGFEPDVFKIFAARNEAESVTAAQTLKNRVQRIAALASAYKGAAERLTHKPNG